MYFFFSSRRRHTRYIGDWSSDVCSSDLVRFGEPAAAVDTGVLEKGAFGDPQEPEQRQQEAEPEFGAFQRRRPLEIVEVDTLGELFCCACACHVFKRCSKSYTNEAPCL